MCHFLNSKCTEGHDRRRRRRGKVEGGERRRNKMFFCLFGIFRSEQLALAG